MNVHKVGQIKQHMRAFTLRSEWKALGAGYKNVSLRIIEEISSNISNKKSIFIKQNGLKLIY